MLTRIDAELEGRPAVGGEAGRRACQHVGVLARQRSEIGRVAIVGREGGRANEEFRAVCERHAGFGEARQRIRRPCNCCGLLDGGGGGRAA